MLKKEHFFTIVVAVALLLLGLILVQLYWVKNAYRLKQIELDNRLKTVMEDAVKTVETEAFSFNLFGRSYISPGEGIVVLRTNNAGRDADTIRLFNSFPYHNKLDTCFYSTDISYYDALTMMDLNMRFEYRRKDTLIDAAKQNEGYNDMVKENYRSMLQEHLPVKDRINTYVLDSSLKKLMHTAGINNRYEYGICKQGNDSFDVISKPGTEKQLKQSTHRITFLDDRAFTQPYELVIWLADKDAYIRNALLWLLTASAAIILLLVAAFVYFFRTVLKQKKIGEMKTDFINNMTHEFMTPVTNISLALETLDKMDKVQGVKQKQIMGVIAVENEHLRDNINKVLQVAVLERGSFLLDVTPLDIHEILQRVTRSFEMAVSSKGGNIVYELQAAHHFVQADETHILNMFYNIMDNAVKYAGGNVPHIKIGTGNANKKLWVSITDNGIGMSAGIQKHIFDKFYRAASGNVHDVKGFGLGLTYVKSIADAHDITVDVASDINKGTMFTFWFHQ